MMWLFGVVLGMFWHDVCVCSVLFCLERCSAGCGLGLSGARLVDILWPFVRLYECVIRARNINEWRQFFSQSEDVSRGKWQTIDRFCAQKVVTSVFWGLSGSFFQRHFEERSVWEQSGCIASFLLRFNVFVLLHVAQVGKYLLAECSYCVEHV